EMTEQRRKLRFRVFFATVRDCRDVKGRGQPGPVGPAFAMDQHRLFGLLHHGEQSCGVILREDFPRRHAEVDMLDPKIPGGEHFLVIPARAGIFTAQIDDGLDAIGLLVERDL
ncbi:hypothetical protein BLX88_23880, partial [Bacillus obstructivus]